MKQQMLKQLLLSYFPTSSVEINSKICMLDFLETYPDCFERSCIPGHFTASAWLLSNDMQRVLLMHHAKLNIWLQLGGHCDGDTNLHNVAIKEAQEESGLNNIELITPDIFDIDIHQIPISKHNPAHLHYDVRFLLKAMDDSAITKNNESLDLKWFDTNFAKFPTRESSILRMFNKWLEFCQDKVK